MRIQKRSGLLRMIFFLFAALLCACQVRAECDPPSARDDTTGYCVVNLAACKCEVRDCYSEKGEYCIPFSEKKVRDLVCATVRQIRRIPVVLIGNWKAHWKM